MTPLGDSTTPTSNLAVDGLTGAIIAVDQGREDIAASREPKILSATVGLLHTVERLGRR